MKKIISVFMCVMLCFVCLILGGCDTEFAKELYSDDEEIASSNHYVTSGSVKNNTSSGFTGSYGKFDGCETIKNYSTNKEAVKKFNIKLSLAEGQAKIVLVAPDNTVTVIAECKGGESFSQSVELNMTKGGYKFKLVGYDCEDVKISWEIGTSIF